MNLSDLKELYRHMEWADAMVWRAVFASETAMTDQKARELFHHLHLVQHAFLRAWQRVGGDAVSHIERRALSDELGARILPANVRALSDVN